MAVQGYFKGDTLHFYRRVNMDLTNCIIRAEMFDISGRSLKLATANSGGSDAMIKVTNATQGRFTITIPKATWYYWNDKSWCEIQVQDAAGELYTVDKFYLNAIYRKINWQTPS